MKNSDLFYRDLFLPEWDADMAAFFNVALAELMRYSKDHPLSDWEWPVPVITERYNFFEIEFNVPGLHPESIFAEAIEDVIVLSGTRCCRLPNEEHERLLFFQRVVQIPKRADEKSLRVYLRFDSKVILWVRALSTMGDEKWWNEAGNGGAKPMNCVRIRGNGT